ncbi:hypothetical protein F4819DRAFT_135961 [Hypoxylon fuscum]|nr:hypothetical protein F4819DRAFT_135961 [Hypoxylon fuscum]
MLGMAFLFFILLQFCCRSSYATIASATPSIILESTNEQPNPAPTPPPLLKLKARQRADSLCGYYDGDGARPFFCPSGYDCLHNNGFDAVGCVSFDDSGNTMGAVYTGCLDYDAYMNNLCYGAGSRIGCCQDPDYPNCVKNTYSGSVFEGYTMVQCGRNNARGAQLVWDATISGTSTITMFVVIPTTDTNTPTDTSTQAQTQASTSLPIATPTAQSGGLSTSDKITLGTALGIGLPAAIAGIIAAWYTYKAWQRRKKGTLLKDSDQDSFLPDNSEGSPESSTMEANQNQATARLL